MYEALGGSVKDFFKGAGDIGVGVLKTYAGVQEQSGAIQAYEKLAAQQLAIEEAKAKARAEQSMPSWVLPVAIGGGVLLLAVVLLSGGKSRE